MIKEVETVLYETSDGQRFESKAMAKRQEAYLAVWKIADAIYYRNCGKDAIAEGIMENRDELAAIFLQEAEG